MKTISRYSSLICISGVLVTTSLLAQNGANTSASATSPTPNAMSASTPATSDTLTSSLQSADYSTRNQIVTEVDQRLSADKDTLKNVKKEGRRLDGQAKSDFKAAWDDVEAREKDLKHSAHQAKNASQDQWDMARSQLASNFQAYESAVARLQTQVGTSANTSTMSK